MGKILSLEEFLVLFGTVWRGSIPRLWSRQFCGWMLKAWHWGWQNSAQFRAVCVKVLESQCIMGATVWPHSAVRECCTELSSSSTHGASDENLFSWWICMKYEVFRQYVWAIHPLSSGGEVDCTNRLHCSIYPQPCLLYVGKWINGHE